MKKEQRIPIEERLSRDWADWQRIPAMFGVYFDSYFSTLSEMSGNQYYNDLYENCLSELTPPCGYCLFQEAVEAAETETGEDAELRCRQLCRILMEPFADSSIWGEKEEKNGTIHDNARTSA